MKNILIIVDMQNGFLENERTSKLVDKYDKLLSLNLFDTVIATRFINSTDSVYEKLLNWKMMKSDSEIAVPDKIAKHVDYFVDKYIYNCVNSDFIQRLCQFNGGSYPEKVFIAGVDTDCCVLTIATSLFEMNIRPIVLTEYTDSNGGLESHKAGILALKRLIGEKQITDIVPKSKSNLDSI